MSLTVNTKTYSADVVSPDRITYAGPAKTVSAKDDLTLSRVRPKPTKVFSGVGRAEAKLVRTLSLTAALTPTAEAQLAIAGTVPVGAASADIDAMIVDLGTWIQSADGKAAIKSQLINK
ncbi:MAG: hypothetical protein [Sanya solspi-like virus 3]|nr:MAG: hypothetical protein [Sanya solspi-like virus 3]